MNTTASSIGAPGSTWPVLRAKTQIELYRNPSPELLLKIVCGLGRGNPYLVLERLDAPSKDYFAQALHRPDGTWLVEYREGSRNRHYQASPTGPGVVYQVLAGWALQFPGWRRPLTWWPVYQ